MSPKRPEPTAARFAGALGSEPAPAEAPPTEPTPVRSRPVRVTVDLEPELHLWLRRQALDAGVPAAELVRGLLDLALERPAVLAEAVGAARARQRRRAGY